MKKITAKLQLLILSLLLNACVSTHPTAVMNIRTADYLNPDINGQASPIVVTIFQLKSAFVFNSATYSALANTSSETLGNDLIDKETLELRPSQKQTLHLILQQDTKQLGIVAAYRSIDGTIWHQVIPVNNKGKTHIEVNLESQGLAVTQKDKCYVKCQ
jgi:type VI secretion system protein VasD